MRWHTADFDAMSWEAVRVHGFRIVENGDGTAELQLDLDFILEWPENVGAGDGFRVAQAMLQFHEVSGLRVALDYVAFSAGMSPFAIDRIERAPLRDIADDEEDRGPWRWRVLVGWPEGLLEFEASGFSQWLVGDVVARRVPVLAPAQRM